MFLALSSALVSIGTLASAPAPTSPFAGHWAGTYEVAPGNGGVTEITIADNGRITGTYINDTQGVSGIVLGEVRNNGSFRAMGFRNDLPQGVDVTCGVFEIVGGRLVTASWGTPPAGCDVEGMWQDLERR